MNGYCIHSRIKSKELDNDVYDIQCLDCGLEFQSSYCGIIHYCPTCNKDVKTSCCACGCGMCLECGYRYTCRPINTQIISWNPETRLMGDFIYKEPIIFEENKSEVKFEAIDRTNYRIES